MVDPSLKAMRWYFALWQFFGLVEGRQRNGADASKRPSPCQVAPSCL